MAYASQLIGRSIILQKVIRTNHYNNKNHQRVTVLLSVCEIHVLIWFIMSQLKESRRQ